MIIVVGGNGFLGRHVCELLARDKQPAVVVSRTPHSPFFERFSRSLTVVDTVEFASPAGREILAEAQAVIYLAWRSVPATFACEPWREMQENVQPALEFFLRVADATPRAKMVFLSSGGTVYGSEGTLPKSETMPTRPISAYGLGKLMAEEALRFVGRTSRNPYAILRVSNAVGQWQAHDLQGIVGVALRAARDGLPIQLFGTGLQVRDFVDADDVAEAIYAASLDTQHPAATWNVGSGVGIRIIDLIAMASRVIDRPIRIEPAPSRSMDVPHVVLDCKNIGKDLGWNAATPIEQSISTLWQAICKPL